MTVQTFDLGVDIGGTFTDIVLVDQDGRVRRGKVLSDRDQPDVAVLHGVRTLLESEGLDPAAVRRAVHGTTLVANALIERRGARTALLTTRGFRDVLGIGREFRYDIYDLDQEMPTALVPRRLVLEVAERTLANGEVRSSPDEAEVRQHAKRLAAENVESLAIVLLHAYANPDHEAQLRRLLEEHAPGLRVTISSDVVPEVGEYERTSTTVANAYVLPIVTDYLGRLAHGLRELGVTARLFLMLSDAGIATLETAQRVPIRLVESGPAGGAGAASWVSRELALKTSLAFDMGGTTAKACFLQDGEPVRVEQLEVARTYRFKKGSGLPLRVPVVDMIEIGAGGGSIARINALGIIEVGPESASASPGPACYGLGGTRPTVTDADLVLGYLDPGFFLGGTMALDQGLAEHAIQTHIAEPLGIGLVDAAWGIHESVNESMAAAVRAHAVEHGVNLRENTLIAFGGAGPVHAHQLARKLGIPRLVCPPGAGVLSAFGFVTAPVAFQFSRSRPTALTDLTWPILDRIYRPMEDSARQLLADAKTSEVVLQRVASVRYEGQGFSLKVDVPSERREGEPDHVLRERFEATYRGRYGRLVPDVEAIAVTWHLNARGEIPSSRLAEDQGSMTMHGATARTRPIFVPDARAMTAASVYRREELVTGSIVEGPAAIEERESTLVLSGQATGQVDRAGNLIIDVVHR